MRNPVDAMSRLGAAGLMSLALMATTPVAAQVAAKNLAPGFTTLPTAAKVVLMPTDVELFSISGGGIAEPKADWTEAAARYFKAAMVEKKTTLGLQTQELAEKDIDELEEINTVHAAVARSIALHHFGPGFLHLPTKGDKLDWSMGEAVREIKLRTGADYALFSWVRDSYASSERVATMVVMALFGVGVPGGVQVGYASLVDLNSGQVVWFNRLARASGDLREQKGAVETVSTLLDQFPVAK